MQVLARGDRNSSFDFDTAIAFDVVGDRRFFDMTPAGERFLMLTSSAETVTQSIHVVLNWFQELTERVPVP